jgi:hypothetical protein
MGHEVADRASGAGPTGESSDLAVGEQLPRFGGPHHSIDGLGKF